MMTKRDKPRKENKPIRSLPPEDPRIIAKSSHRIKATKLNIGLPFNLGSLEFEKDELTTKTAWNLYLETSTRIPIGSKFETFQSSLASLYSVFDVTREILKSAGPDIAHGQHSLGITVIETLNKGIRPFLAKWHSLLTEHEEKRPLNINIHKHEQSWEYAEEFQNELNLLQGQLLIYLDVLEKMSGMQ